MSDSVGNRGGRYTIAHHEVRRALRLDALQQMLARCEAADGRPPLGDHALSAVAQEASTIYGLTLVDPSSRLVAYAQATTTAEASPTWTADIAVDPSHRHDRTAILDIALGALLDQVQASRAHAVQWWCHEPTDADHSIAESHGLIARRQLLEMHLHLDAGPTNPSITTRSFDAEVDEPALLEVNNLAFVHHPDQGNWTHDSLAGRFASDWFDPAGLLVHTDSAGEVVGFCWTKIHRPAGRPPIGEIYVVAVRPSHHGQGLGRALTRAGLASLHERHIDHVMLFVDGANATARGIYEHLGFTVRSTTTAFQWDVAQCSGGTAAHLQAATAPNLVRGS